MVRISNAFVRGVARSADMFGMLRSHPDIYAGQQKDADALRGDWYKIGNDIREATAKYVKQTKAVS